jgi:hypothetical protein
LIAPGVKLFQPRSPSVLKAVSQLHLHRRDDEHLDVGDLISDTARHAAGQHHLLRHFERERISDALG